MEENKPTYEQLANAYTSIIKELEGYKVAYSELKSNTVLQRLNTMLNIIEHKDLYPQKIYKLAVWHAEQIMAKPKA